MYDLSMCCEHRCLIPSSFYYFKSILNILLSMHTYKKLSHMQAKSGYNSTIHVDHSSVYKVLINFVKHEFFQIHIQLLAFC